MKSTVESIPTVLAVMNLVAFFIPGTREFFQQTISVPLGAVSLAVILGWLLWMRGREAKVHLSATGHVSHRSTPAQSGQQPRQRKTLYIEFPKDSVMYALSYPTDQEDIVNCLDASSPRCLVHKVFMKQKRSRTTYGGLGPVRWVCSGCGHSLSLEENERLEVLAKAQALEKIH